MKTEDLKNLPKEFDFKSNINTFGLLYHAEDKGDYYKVTCVGDLDCSWEFDKKSFYRDLLRGNFVIDEEKVNNMVCIDITKQKELLELCKLEQSILTDGKINPDTEGYFPCAEDEPRVKEFAKLQDKYTYGWYIARECLEDQIKSINRFKTYIIEH